MLISRVVLERAAWGVWSALNPIYPLAESVALRTLVGQSAMFYATAPAPGASQPESASCWFDFCNVMSWRCKAPATMSNQHCRMLQVDRSFDKVECCFDIDAVFGKNVAGFGNNFERNFIISTKSKQIEHVQFVSTLSKGRSIDRSYYGRHTRTERWTSRVLPPGESRWVYASRALLRLWKYGRDRHRRTNARPFYYAYSAANVIMTILRWNTIYMAR